MLLCLALAAELIAAAALVARPAPPPSAPARHTAAFVDLGGQPTAPLRARIAAEIDGAVAAVTGFWGDDWPREIVVVTTGTDAQFAEQAGGPAAQWVGVAAVAVADRVDPARHTAEGQRIVFAPGAASMSDWALRIVLRHELFHYAARAATAADAPQWLTEGVADYVARPPDPPPGTAAVPATLPSDADFAAAGTRRSTAYDQAWWFARFVADRYGPAKLRQVYLQACGTGHPEAGVAVAAALGVSLPDLLADWQRWLAG